MSALPHPSSLLRRPVPHAAAESADPLLQVQHSLRLIGTCAWAFMCLHAFLTPRTHQKLSPELQLPWLVAMLAFGFCFVQTTRCPPTQVGKRRVLCLAAVEAVLALLANLMIHGNSVLAGLLLLVTLQVGLVLPLLSTLLWVGGQTAALLTILLWAWHNTDALAYASGYLCFQLFGAYTAQILTNEIWARKKLAATIDELRATRALLGEASRQAERLDISRELHDVMGHHLTALSMNLQVASHLTPPSQAQFHLQKAEEVTQKLLQDVRTTVKGLRASAADPSGNNFRQEVQRLSQSSTLLVHLTFAPDFNLSCPIQAHVFLRTVQEIMTNTSRHAHARQLWLRFHRERKYIVLSAHDDGCGAANLTPGCGLKGMRERLEVLGGTLSFKSDPRQGFALCATLPTSSETSQVPSRE